MISTSSTSAPFSSSSCFLWSRTDAKTQKKISQFPQRSLPSQKKLMTCQKEIEYHKTCGKHIAKNRYVYDARYDSPANWPIWPTNIYCTAAPNNGSCPLSQSRSETPTLQSTPYLEYFGDNSDDSSVCAADGESLKSQSFDEEIDEPKKKKMRKSSSIISSITLPSQPVYSETPDGFNELDCELLSSFFDFSSDSNDTVSESLVGQSELINLYEAFATEF